MKHATTYRSGLRKNARQIQTAGTASAGSCLHAMDATNKGCTGNQQRQKKVCTETGIADGFLKTRFLPKLQTATVQQSSVFKSKRLEKDFYQSLRLFKEHYPEFTPSDTSCFAFPYNFSLIFSEAKSFLKNNVQHWNALKLMQNEKGKSFLTSEEQYNTGSTLYYIPIIPLYRMLKNRETHKAACLLLSVFAYLYKMVGIPYYMEKNSYIYWQYEMLAEWVSCEEDITEAAPFLKELKAAEWAGKWMQHKILPTHNLIFFEQRIKRFVARTEMELDCLHIAQRCWDLYNDYPNATVFSHAVFDETEHDDEWATMDRYISFIADIKGRLFESLTDNINCEFNEYRGTQEPTLLKNFLKGHSLKDTLDFENRLFPLLTDLTNLLYDY